MVYRYESDEDAFQDYREPYSGRSVLRAGPPPPARPSPSRFPTPSLPRKTRITSPPTEPPPARATAPVPAPPVDQPPARATEPAPPPPVDQHPARATAQVPAPPARATEPAPPPPVEHLPPAPPMDPPGARGGGGGGRLWQVVVGGAAVLVLLALCGLGAAALLMERDPQPQVAPAYQPGSAAPVAHHLDSRDTDQAPLTAKELFPGIKLVVSDGQPAYQVLRTHSSGSCAVAATGEIADLLVRLGCNQVVRATLRTPDGQHLVTTGLFNLTDRTSAERARDQIRQLLDERQGRLRGMAADAQSEVIATAPARVGWQVRGHYVAYAVVARVDGATIQSGDPKVREILFDMIELHLNRGVLERRANGGTAGQPTADAGNGTGPQVGEDAPGR